MKRPCAFLMSLVLLAAQFFLVSPLCRADAAAAGAAARHSCCAPVKMACNALCCVARGSAPRDASVPLPVTDHGPHITPLVLLFALWTLPSLTELPASSSASASGAVSAPPVPLFLRTGALLI